MKNQCNTLRQIPAVSGGRQKDSSRELANAGNSKPHQKDIRGQMVVLARARAGGLLERSRVVPSEIKVEKAKIRTNWYVGGAGRRRSRRRFLVPE